MRNFIMLCAIIGASAMAGAEVNFQLVENGKANAVVVLPAEPDDTERLAADELIEHVRLMSGIDLPLILGEPEDSGPGMVRIGAAAPTALLKRLPDPEIEAAFVYEVTPEAIHLRGATPEGTANAVYTLLETLGVRWFMPGNIGRVVPSRKTVSVPCGTVVASPDFRYRQLGHVQTSLPWTRRNRLSHDQFRYGAHGFPGIRSKDERETVFQKHPEWFALIDEIRVKRQMCVSNPKLIDYVAESVKEYWHEHPDESGIGIGPNDGYGYCQCEDCQSLDSGRHHPWSGQPSYTDRYIYFINAVIAEVEKEYPDKQYHFYIYQSHLLPPTIPPHPAIVGITAPINFDRIHGIDNPRSLDRRGYAEIMAAWAEKLPVMMERGYYFNLADPALPFSKIHALPALMKWTKRLGFVGHSPETKASWASNGPTLYIATKLYWDAAADPYAILDDYADKFFGPAASPMREYLLEIDEAWRTVQTMAGGMYAVPQVFPPDRTTRLRRLLNTAMSQVDSNSVYARRLALFDLNFRALEGFLQFWHARNQCDFAVAKEGYDRAGAAIHEQANYLLAPKDEQPGEVELSHNSKIKLMQQGVLLNPTGPHYYLKRFWDKVVNDGYARTVTDGEVIVQLPETWDFLIDPTDAGRWGHWYRDGEMQGNWQRMHTLTATWSDQGYHYYKGVAWYRTYFDLPESISERKPLYLWFSGIDDKAEVWVNGRSLGTTVDPGLGLPGVPRAFDPVDFDITNIVRFDQPNTIALRVENFKPDELGTGGITGPVMIWTPRPGHSDPVQQ